MNNGFDQSSSASLTVPALPEQYMNNADRTDLGIDLTAESDASGNITVDLDIPSECSDNQVTIFMHSLWMIHFVLFQ